MNIETGVLRAEQFSRRLWVSPYRAPFCSTVNPFIKWLSLFYVYFLFTLLKQSNLNENS